MDSKRLTRGRWKCRHEGGHATILRTHERMERPPHYVIRPDCGTHWIVYADQMSGETRAMPVVTRVVVP